jgi:hypothetical protein
MRKLNKNSVAIVAVSLVFGLMGSSAAFAQTTPSLGGATPYGVLGSTYSNSSAATAINGNLGYITGPATPPTVSGATHVNDSLYSQAGIDEGSARIILAAESCTYSFPSGDINLSTDLSRPSSTTGTYTPGVYCVTGAMDVAGPLTLNGSGTYIFRSTGALTSDTGSIVTLNGASACDVFWTPGAATTLAANTTFKGTVIEPGSGSAITVGATTTWTGRALALGGQ